MISEQSAGGLKAFALARFVPKHEGTACAPITPIAEIACLTRPLQVLSIAENTTEAWTPVNVPQTAGSISVTRKRGATHVLGTLLQTMLCQV